MAAGIGVSSVCGAAGLGVGIAAGRGTGGALVAAPLDNTLSGMLFGGGGGIAGLGGGAGGDCILLIEALGKILKILLRNEEPGVCL